MVGCDQERCELVPLREHSRRVLAALDLAAIGLWNMKRARDGHDGPAASSGTSSSGSAGSHTAEADSAHLEDLRRKRQAKLQHFYDDDSSDYSSDDDEYGSSAVKASVSTSIDDSSDYSGDDDEYGSNCCEGLCQN